MVQDDGPVGLDGVAVVFDDERVVSDAGLMLAATLTRARKAGAGPGEGRLTVDVDSFVGEVFGHAKQGAAFGYTRTRGYHPIVASTRSSRRERRPASCCTSVCARARRTPRA